jgi:hypothetical protein
MAGDVELAFIAIGAGKSVAVPTIITGAREASVCIVTGGIHVTSAIVDQTLVDVDTVAVEGSSDVFVSDVTGTVVSAPEICTEGVTVATVKGEISALVDVKAGVVADAVAVESSIACACEATHGIVARCFHIAGSILRALVDIDACSIVIASGEDPVESVTDVARVMRAVLDRPAGGVQIAVASNKVGFAGASDDAGD